MASFDNSFVCSRCRSSSRRGFRGQRLCETCLDIDEVDSNDRLVDTYREISRTGWYDGEEEEALAADTAARGRDGKATL